MNMPLVLNLTSNSMIDPWIHRTIGPVSTVIPTTAGPTALSTTAKPTPSVY